MRQKLAQIRLKNNMTQADVAEAAHISQGYYSDIESGLRCPSPQVVKSISKALRIPREHMYQLFYENT